MSQSESEVTRARVSFRKSVSDGNYGSESAEVSIDVPLGEVYDFSEESVAATLAAARRLVHDELRNSPSRTVQRALEYPRLDAVKQAAAEAAIDDLEDLPFDEVPA